MDSKSLLKTERFFGYKTSLDLTKPVSAASKACIGCDKAFIGCDKAFIGYM